jgi:hypothetical protein
MSTPRHILDKIAALRQGQQPSLPMDELPGSAAQSTPPQEPKSPPVSKEPARIHPDKRGGVLLANLVSELQGEKATNQPPISYYSPELIQATLPHSDPKTPIWVRKNGDFSLVVTSGASGNGEFIGIPYGSFPRLVLAYITTRVVATHERRIELSSHFGMFLKEIGYSGNLRGNILPARRVKDQLYKLLNA